MSATGSKTIPSYSLNHKHHYLTLYPFCKIPICRFILALAGCFILSESAAQSNSLLKTKFNCKAISGTATILLRELSAYSGVNIEFSPSSLDCCKNYVLPAGETSLGAALDIILTGQPVTVAERHHKIIIGRTDTPLPEGYLQERHVLYGYIQQENSLEPLPFASVKVLSATAFTQSNVHGFYSLSLPAGKHTLQVSFSGTAAKTVVIDLQKNTPINFILSPVLLPEVQIDAGNQPRKDAAVRLDRYKGGMYSNMLGETDPVRSMYLLPGNTESQESGGKLLVRGGDPGQSTFLLDGNPVFNPAHLLGEISILANTSIKSVLQYKNDFPSRLSGGISSITAINTKEGNMERWSGEAEAGLSSLAATLEGPLKKQRTAMMVSVRQSIGEAAYRDMFTYDAFFADVHLKLTHIINKRNKLMLSSYLGNDKLELTQDDSQYLQRWNNRLLTLNWNRILGKRAFANTAFNISSYDNYMGLMYTPPLDFGGGGLMDRAALNNYSSGKRYEAKTDVEVSAGDHLQLFFGGRFEHTTIRPHSTLLSDDLKDEFYDFSSKTSLPYRDFMIYYENEIRIGNKLLLRAGIHFNDYSHNGYHYQSFQPRLFSSYVIDRHQRLNIAYTHIGQLLHMITSPYTGIDRELWIPATNKLRPAENRMINIGYEYKDNKTINITADLYYKKVHNATAFAEKANILYSSDTTEKSIISGTGWSYGAEIAVEKRYKNWKALLSYTLSRSWRQFDSLNNGDKHPYRYDRRHNLNLLFSYQPFKHFELSVLWHFHTGDWMTLPSLISFKQEGDLQGSGMDSAPFRGTVYNRVNLNAGYQIPTRGRFRHTLAAGLHSVGQSQNAYTTAIETSTNHYTMPLYKEQLFRFNPYITYKISF